VDEAVDLGGFLSNGPDDLLEALAPDVGLALAYAVPGVREHAGETAQHGRREADVLVLRR